MKRILFLILFIIHHSVFSQTNVEISSIIHTYNIDDLKLLLNNFKLYDNKRLTEVTSFLKNHPDIPKYKTDGRGYFAEVFRISNGLPIYYETYNRHASISTRANFLYSNGQLGLNIEGQNMIAYVWDGGHARGTHNEFNLGGGISKISYGGDSGNVGIAIPNHATHVSGTICANGLQPNAKGVAPQSHVVSYDWNSDLVEATQAVLNGMLLSNHSYGAQEFGISDWEYGAYTIDSRRWDNLMYNAPYYLRVSAAGNDGSSNVNGDPIAGNFGYDKLSYENCAKNGLVVANGQDLIVDSVSGEALQPAAINTSSSQGPTDDLRIKPDITGNGTDLFSPIATSDNAYDTYTGTSMASPNVMASLLLLQQLYNQQNGHFLKSASLKGLALHTADDFGQIGPDSIFGWGYLNTKASAELILDNNQILSELSLNNGSEYSLQVSSVGNGTPLKVSISWTDRPSNNVNSGVSNLNTPVLVADLDVRVEKGSTVFYPWKLTSVNTNTKGDNIVDPYERIDIDNPSGNYVIRISHKGNLPNLQPQNFTLIVSGISTHTANNNDTFFDNNFNVFPNPTSSGKFKIHFYDSSFNGHVLSITNMLGQSIVNRIITNEIELFNLTNLSKGVYYISIDNSLDKKKIIIN